MTEKKSGNAMLPAAGAAVLVSAVISAMMPYVTPQKKASASEIPAGYVEVIDRTKEHGAAIKEHSTAIASLDKEVEGVKHSNKRLWEEVGPMGKSVARLETIYPTLDSRMKRIEDGQDQIIQILSERRTNR